MSHHQFRPEQEPKYPSQGWRPPLSSNDTKKSFTKFGDNFSSPHAALITTKNFSNQE